MLSFQLYANTFKKVVIYMIKSSVWAFNTAHVLNAHYTDQWFRSSTILVKVKKDFLCNLAAGEQIQTSNLLVQP